MAPLLLIGCGLIYAFRASLWNLGMDGQYLLAAAFVAGLGPSVMSTFPVVIGWVVLSLVAMGIGAAWTLIPSILKARYGTLADQRYGRKGVVPPDQLERLADALAALFTEDAVWDGGKGLGVARGRAEIRQRFLEPTLEFSWHYFVKPQIHVDGDSARATWDVLAPCTTRGGVPHWMAGFEEDEYRRVNGEWLHSRMQLGMVFMAPHTRGWSRGPGRD